MNLRLLAVSDEVEPQLLDEKTVAGQGRIDLLIGCGDLPADYLDGLATLYAAPLVFVRGNHDPPDRKATTRRMPRSTAASSPRGGSLSPGWKAVSATAADRISTRSGR